MATEQITTVKQLVNQIGIPQLNVEVRNVTGESLYHGRAGNIIEPICDYPAKRVVLVIEALKVPPK